MAAEQGFNAEGLAKTGGKCPGRGRQQFSGGRTARHRSHRASNHCLVLHYCRQPLFL